MDSSCDINLNKKVSDKNKGMLERAYRNYKEVLDFPPLFRLLEHDKTNKNTWKLENELSNLIFGFEPERHYPKYKRLIMHYLKTKKEECNFDKVKLLSELDSTENMQQFKQIISHNFLFNIPELNQLNIFLQNLNSIGALKWILSAALLCFRNWNLQKYTCPNKAYYTIDNSKTLKKVFKSNQLIYYNQFITAYTYEEDKNKQIDNKDNNTLLVEIEFDYLTCSNIHKHYYPVLIKSTKEIIIAPFTFFYITDYNANENILYLRSFHYHPIFDLIYDFLYDIRCNTYLLPTEESKAIYREKITILEDFLSNINPSLDKASQKITDKIYKCLSKLYLNIFDYHNAIMASEKALNLAIDTFGDKDIKVGTVLVELAITNMKNHNFSNAVTLLEKAITIFEEKLSENNLSKAFAYNLLGENHWNLGDNNKSISFLEKSLAIRQNELGDYHPDSVLSISNLGVAYEYLGKNKKALELGEKALKSKLELYGNDCIETAISYNNVATCRGREGNIDGSLEYHTRSISIKIKNLGEYNNHVGISYLNLGKICQEQDNNKEAIYNFEKACEIWEKINDVGIHDMKETYGRLLTVYKKENDYASMAKVILRKINSYLGYFTDKEELIKDVNSFYNYNTLIEDQEKRYSNLKTLESYLKNYYDRDDELFVKLNEHINSYDSKRLN